MDNLKIIEKILIEKGRIVKYANLTKYLAHYKDIDKKIFTLINKELLVNLRKGVYYISKIGSLGYTSISNYIIANVIGQESFVSFEASLAFHGFFDQGLHRYRSISQKQYLRKEIEGVKYEYVRVKDSRYFGFKSESVDGGQARIATKERALLDIIEYKRLISSVSLVLDILAQSIQDIDMVKLTGYLENYSQVTIKVIGLLLDFIGKDSSMIELLIDKKSTSRMLLSSGKFSNKWRLYYDSILEEQIK